MKTTIESELTPRQVAANLDKEVDPRIWSYPFHQDERLFFGKVTPEGFNIMCKWQVGVSERLEPVLDGNIRATEQGCRIRISLNLPWFQRFFVWTFLGVVLISALLFFLITCSDLASNTFSLERLSISLFSAGLPIAWMSIPYLMTPYSVRSAEALTLLVSSSLGREGAAALAESMNKMKEEDGLLGRKFLYAAIGPLGAGGLLFGLTFLRVS